MKFDANVSLLFSEVPLLDRPAAAARAGFDAIEMWWPFDAPEPPATAVDELVDALAAAGVDLVCMNADGGDFEGGERGLLSLPAQRSRFRANLDVVRDIVARTGCRLIHLLYGTAQRAVSPADQRAQAIDNLAWAADVLRPVGARVVLEALNSYEFPTYGLHHPDDVFGLVADVARASGQLVGCQFDVYHAQRGQDDVIGTIRAHADAIWHVQVADVPGRHEPGTGTVPWTSVFAALEAIGYDGSVGLEYIPATTTEDSLAWWREERFIPRREDARA